MKKILSLFVAMLFSVVMFAEPQSGTLTSSPALTDPSATVVLTYDGAGTNFANWEPKCFIHAWLVAADGQSFSTAYETEWIDCNGDAQYDDEVSDNRKMTYAGEAGKHDGKYTISMNIKEFFGVADEDLAKIAKLGVIVCSQYNKNGDDNKTKELYLTVGEGGETPECKDGPYGLIFNGKDTIEAKPFAELDHAGRKQYQADSVVVKAGDKFVIANLSCDAKWVMNVEDAGAAADFEKGENEYTAKKDGMFVFFIKMKMDDDVLYIGEIKDEGGEESKLEEGFYLISSAAEWKVEKLTADDHFTKNEGASGEEYILNTTLTEGQGIKVVFVKDETINGWYPDGMDNEYVVDADHAGEVTIYFRPNKDGEGWEILEGFIYIEKKGTTAIDNVEGDVKAVKVFRDSQLLIIKGEKVYNVMGQVIP